MDAQKELQDALSAFLKTIKEVRKVHKESIKELLKADPTGFTVVYSFLATYCVKGTLRSKDSGVECKEGGLQHYTTDMGILYTAKFEAIIPSKEVVLSFNDWCPTPREDACLVVSAVTKEDESGTKIEGGTVALIPLGVLKRVEVRYKDKATVELKQEEFERHEWKRLPLEVRISDVEKIEFEVKHYVSHILHERIGSGTHKKEYKKEIGTALEIKMV